MSSDPVISQRTEPPLDSLIIGAGFGGLCAAIKLKGLGKRFVVVEKDADLGGTWLVNRYPGCGCDVASHLYSYSFALNPSWSRSFSGSEEIWRYMKSVAERFELGPHLRFNTEVTGLRFDADANLWRVSLRDGETIAAKTVVLATGALSRPALPDVDGLASFKGKVFHSQAWDHDYPLKGKRVAVIGTGASAIQFVPHVAERAGHLDLYQRTPPWILPKPDRALSGTEHALFRRLPWLQKLRRGLIYLANESRVIAFVRAPALLRVFEWVAKRHIRKAIADPELRRTVTPDYRIGCKRVLISNDYYPALARDNVHVIPRGVRAIDETGVIAADGTHRPCATIVLGTGFNVTKPFAPGF
ncbi:MAG: NAD(P)/FAD-dependent oxidoreductase, partial [Pseudomonadota bacterium]